MALSEVDSFFFKYKNLLIAGKKCNPDNASRSWESLAVEVDDLRQVSPNNQGRDGSSRQRRREKRTTARCREVAEVAEHEAALQEENNSADKETEVVSDHESSSQVTNAEEAPSDEAVKAVLHEPLDEIENAVIAKDTKDFTNVLSVIPFKNFNSSDDVLKKAISDKVLAKHFNMKEIEIHRSVRGTFVRGDVLIEPASGVLIKKTDFGFEN
jgi:ATP-dependent exoDNAse (exonuclease V) beta subunit